jgi:hypothetical protein
MDATRRKLVLSAGAALASTAAFGQAPFAQIPSQTGEEMARPDIAYQSSAANQPLRIVNLLQLEPERRKSSRQAATITLPAVPARIGRARKTWLRSPASRSSPIR